MSSAYPPEIPGWDEDHLVNTKDTVCILDGRLLIRWTNARWMEFAEQNDGLPAVMEVWAAGARYTAAIAEPLRSLYEDRFSDCLARQKSWSHQYDCSSPGRFRRFHQVVYPVKSEWLIITNSLVIERDHDAPCVASELYRDENGFLKQCMHCRRVRHAVEDRWDWVPEYIATMQSDTSHSLCGPCFDFYYPDDETGSLREK